MQIVQLARDLVDNLNAHIGTLPHCPTGLQASLSYQPVYGPEELPGSHLHVVPWLLEQSQDEVDTCDVPLSATLAVIFAARLAQPPTAHDSGQHQELERLLTFTGALYAHLSETSTLTYGRPRQVEFASPGASPMYIWEWLQDAGLWCSLYTVTW